MRQERPDTAQAPADEGRDERGGLVGLIRRMFRDNFAEERGDPRGVFEGYEPGSRGRRRTRPEPRDTMPEEEQEHGLIQRIRDLFMRDRGGAGQEPDTTETRQADLYRMRKRPMPPAEERPRQSPRGRFSPGVEPRY